MLNVLRYYIIYYISSWRLESYWSRDRTDNPHRYGVRSCFEPLPRSCHSLLNECSSVGRWMDVSCWRRHLGIVTDSHSEVVLNVTLVRFSGEWALPCWLLVVGQSVHVGVDILSFNRQHFFGWVQRSYLSYFEGPISFAPVVLSFRVFVALYFVFCSAYFVSSWIN